ncbi:MAG: RHS repeat-associated core domain-containing protein [Caldilineaceae bacterium]
MVNDEKYKTYGKQRDTGTVSTDHRFTGQNEDGSGLMYYGARFYDPQTGMFVSPDTVVPDAGLVFAYNRNMYVYGRVMNANDPSGHAANDKAITAGDGAGSLNGNGNFEAFHCSYGVCVPGAGIPEIDEPMYARAMSSHNKDIASAMAFIGGGEGAPQTEPLTVVDAALNEAGIAQAVTPSKLRPGAAGALEVNGKVYTAQSAKGGISPKLNPQVQEVLDNIPPEQRSFSHGFCVEPQCISQALDDGVDPKGG